MKIKLLLALLTIVILLGYSVGSAYTSQQVYAQCTYKYATITARITAYTTANRGKKAISCLGKNVRWTRGVATSHKELLGWEVEIEDGFWLLIDDAVPRESLLYLQEYYGEDSFDAVLDVRYNYIKGRKALHEKDRGIKDVQIRKRIV